MKTLALFLTALAVVGCTSTAPRSASTGSPASASSGGAAAPSTFTGEVWVWDEQASTVTLRQATRTIRVKVTPDQLAGLRLYQVATIRGELAPAEIETVAVPPGALVPRGDADQVEILGTVRGFDPVGKVAVASPQGPLTLWIAQPGDAPFRSGDRVTVRMRVQPFDVAPAHPGQPPRARDAEPAASIGSEPGEYAAVKGRVTAIAPDGRLTLESPRGPITVAVPNVARYRVGDTVEAHTSVHLAR
ncbi:MAG TPA: hypothetical protein VLF19_04580 [Methylomirabilota bacterium]|nr:hypothetical protein [Methylomirabilota bacterium]